MFREALDYPTRPPHGGRAVVVGGLLLAAVAVLVAVGSLGLPYAAVVPLAVGPWLLVRGYYVAALRAAIGHDVPRPPAFADYRRLLADGVRAVAIAIGYLLPVIVVLSPLVLARYFDANLAALLTGAGFPADVVAAVLSAVGVIALFALMYLLGALYALPVAVSLYAHTGRLRAAFDLRTVVAGATTEDYVVAWLVSLLLQLLLIPVAYLLRVLVVGFFLQLLVSVGVRYCYGQGVGAALDLEPVVPVPTAEAADPEPAGRPVPAVRRVGDAAEHDWDRRRPSGREGERT